MIYPFIRFYLQCIIPLLGRLVASDAAAYAYLSGSTMDFHEAGELADLFRQAGFSEVGFKKFMFGTISVHWGTK
jgi:demethylmenaquinone methyltransferase/2-methoxy-6-polyprenyl-1,4-benzoquinol methylase